MPGDLTGSQRRFVARRAEHRCEYCLLHADGAYLPHHVDHIISRKHNGPWVAANLAYACFRCNTWKGSDVGAIDPESGAFVRLFHPRRDYWDRHCALYGAVIRPLTAEGRATERLLKLNIADRVIERRVLIAVSRYPVQQ